MSIAGSLNDYSGEIPFLKFLANESAKELSLLQWQ